MGLRSARFSLEQCLAGSHRMRAVETNISVMRVEEALTTLGFRTGPFDGVFGPTTGQQVSTFKVSRGLSPSDPMVGPGTSGQLDAELFIDPPSLDPAFDELALFVAAHSVEPFVGFALAGLLDTPLNSQRHDVVLFLLSVMTSTQCLGIVAVSRAGRLNDPLIPADVIRRLSNIPGSGSTVHFIGADGLMHDAICIADETILGKDYLTHYPSGRRAWVDLRGRLCHELTHIRNDGLDLQSAPLTDPSTFIDPDLAARVQAGSGKFTGDVFYQFAHEMVARHVDWMIEHENAGDPFAARFLDPAALAEGAHVYFAETDPAKIFSDNGDIAGSVAQGDALIYTRIALCLRRCAERRFSGDADVQDISGRVVRVGRRCTGSLRRGPQHGTPRSGQSFPALPQLPLSRTHATESSPA
jgi:hypothetical protein